MKTPEEIKKGLGCCQTIVRCSICPYHDIGNIVAECTAKLSEDALAYIQQLESRLAQVERERDAAVADLQLYAGCKVCMHGDFKFTQECMDCSYDNNNWQWRGPCPENTKEDET